MELMRNDALKAHLPCCTITAISVFTGIKFEHVWHEAKTSYAKNWRGRTHNHVQQRLMKKFNKGRTAGFRPGRMTLQKFHENQSRKNVAYLIYTTGHCQVMVNGYVVDQKGVVHISEFHGRRKIVTHAYAKSVDNVTFNGVDITEK